MNEFLQRADQADLSGEGVECWLVLRTGMIPVWTVHRVNEEVARGVTARLARDVGATYLLARISRCGCRDGSISIGPVVARFARGSPT